MNLNLEQPNFSTRPFLRLGFRPFFFAAGVFAILSMLVWGFLFYHHLALPSRIALPHWHAHEMIFGYFAAVVVGFLLTAVKNWTNIQTIYAAPLLLLLLLWLAARLLIFLPENYLAPQAIIDASFLIIATVAIAAPIIKTCGFSHLPIIGKMLLFAAAHIVFYLGVFEHLKNGEILGIYLGFYTVVGLILMMSRRLIPFFIERAVEGAKPENSKFLDISALVVFLGFIITAVFFAKNALGVAFSTILFVIHSIRFYRWYHPKIWRHPLLWSIYLGYGMMALGFLIYALSYFKTPAPNLDIHTFAFAAALMTVGMMARVTLGHTGRDVLAAPQKLAWIFAPLIIAFGFRVIVVAADFSHYTTWIFISQGLWIFAFLVFLMMYIKMFFQARVDGRFG